MNLTFNIKPNKSSIINKIKSWANSAEGARKTRAKINEYIDKDIRTTQSGWQVVTLARVNEMAKELCDMITANAAGLPQSIRANVETIKPARASRNYTGAISAEISFSSVDMSRPSLAREKYGDLNNIVALFEIGDSEPHPQIHVRIKDANGATVQEQWSTSYVEGRHFIADAVDDFNSKYSGLGVTATVNEPYA